MTLHHSDTTGFDRTHTRVRPRFEGCNICTWIGFKHVMYCIEEAVVDHFRAHGFGPRELYEQKVSVSRSSIRAYGSSMRFTLTIR